MLQPCRTETLTSEPFHALCKARSHVFIGAHEAALGPPGLWHWSRTIRPAELPQLLRPKPAGLPFGHNGTEVAAARRTRAVLAAKIGVIRGDLWAEAAFTGARFMGTDRSTSLDRANSGQFTRASQRGDGLRVRPGQWRGMAFFGEPSGKFAGRREPRWDSSRTIVFHGAECLGPRPLAPRTRQFACP
jgi:hypothetical protein